MFIRDLHVDGYGALHDVHVSFRTPLSVVYGPNEAGKSTLLRFIRSMLYGIPSRKEPVERGEPVSGGRHGGRMAVLASDGKELLLERYASDGGGRRGPGGGPIVRETGGGTQLRPSQADWERKALGGVSERLFRQLFAVTLDDLHELLALQGEEVGNYLYHAGLAGGTSLAEARRRLNAEMDKLYRPKGSTQEMNRLLAERRELETAIRLSRNSVERYLQATEAWNEAQRRLAELERQMPPLAAHAASLRGTLDLREWWLKRQALTGELREWEAQLPHPAAPALSESAASEWPGLRMRRDAAETRLQEARQRVREIAQAREALRWDESLLARLPELDKLEAMRERVAAGTEEKEAAAAERHHLEETADALMSHLSADWSLTDLQAFAGVLAEREPLRRLQASWAEASKARERLEEDAGRIRRQLEALLGDRETAAGGAERVAPYAVDAGQADSRTDYRHEADAFGPLRPATREELLTAWNELEDELRRLERLQAEWRYGHAAAGGRPGLNRLPIAAGWLLGIAAIGALFGAGWFYRNGMIPASAIGLLIAIAAGSGAWMAARRARSRGSSADRVPSDAAFAQIQASRARAEALLNRLLEQPGDRAQALLGRPDASRRPPRRSGAADLPALNEDLRVRLRQAVQARQAELEMDERERLRARDRSRKLAELKREEAALMAEIGRADERIRTCMTDWAEWLRRCKLPLTLTPDVLPDLLHAAEQGQATLRRRAAVLARIEALERAQSAFAEAAGALLRAYPPPDALAADPGLAIAWLRRQAEDQRRIKAEAEQLDRLRGDAGSAEEQASIAWDQAAAAIRRFVEEAGERDEPAMELRLRIDERRRAIRREIREIDVRLEAGKTPEALAAMYRLLGSRDESELSVMARQAADEWEALNVERTALLDQRGRLAQELDRLRKESETEDRVQQLADLDGKLHRLAGRYALLAVSDRLLETTKAVFEEERQPEVLRRASAYFARMTEGAYVKISVPGDRPAVFAETGDRRQVDSSFLSRGTKEQLYLSMRFALADAVSREANLPLLLDDLFVHFDERRLLRTISVLGDIAQSRQIILFTCHRHVAEAVKRVYPDAGFTDWGRRLPAEETSSSGLG